MFSRRFSVRVASLILALVVPGILGGRVTLAQQSPESQIRRLDSLWARMYAQHDTALALQLYAEDLEFTSSTGTRKNRSQELGDVRAQPGLVMHFFRTTPSDIIVRDSTATVTGSAEWRFAWGGSPRDIRRSYTMVYSRGGPLGWQIRTVRMGG